MRGSVIITTIVMGKITKVRLTDLYFAANLERNIISYGMLEGKGCKISTGPVSCSSRIERRTGCFDVGVRNNGLVVRAQKCELDTTGRDVMMSVLSQHEENVGQDVQKGSLLHFYKRLAHLNHDTIIKMAKDTA